MHGTTTWHHLENIKRCIWSCPFISLDSTQSRDLPPHILVSIRVCQHLRCVQSSHQVNISQSLCRFVHFQIKFKLGKEKTNIKTIKAIIYIYFWQHVNFYYRKHLSERSKLQRVETDIKTPTNKWLPLQFRYQSPYSWHRRGTLLIALEHQTTGTDEGSSQ